MEKIEVLSTMATGVTSPSPSTSPPATPPVGSALTFEEFKRLVNRTKGEILIVVDCPKGAEIRTVTPGDLRTETQHPGTLARLLDSLYVIPRKESSEEEKGAAKLVEELSRRALNAQAPGTPLPSPRDLLACSPREAR